MSFLIDDANLPATLTAAPMTDEEFTSFCAEHPDLDFEMTAEGEIIVMAPTHSTTGVRNFDVAGQLYVWARRDRRGFLCDSSSGFVLPNGARRSPDASLILRNRINVGEPNKREKHQTAMLVFGTKCLPGSRPADACAIQIIQACPLERRISPGKARRLNNCHF